MIVALFGIGGPRVAIAMQRAKPGAYESLHVPDFYAEALAVSIDQSASDQDANRVRAFRNALDATFGENCGFVAVQRRAKKARRAGLGMILTGLDPEVDLPRLEALGAKIVYVFRPTVPDGVASYIPGKIFDGGDSNLLRSAVNLLIQDVES